MRSHPLLFTFAVSVAITAMTRVVHADAPTATPSTPAAPRVTHGPDYVPPIDRPMSVAWPVANSWNDGMEHEYSDFVAQLGRAVAARRCQTIDECLRDPTANTLFDPETDAHFRLRVDCADLPYVLRAYFAWKRRLPFGIVSSIDGEGQDDRYMLHVHPNHWITYQRFPTPHDLLSEIGSIVHSGMYRMAPDIEDGDFYQAAINRHAIRPGTTFYDPNGHVLVVADVRPDGNVYMMDGHPDGSLTWKRFGEAFVTGTARLGGGFKNFRPIRWHDGQVIRARNAEIPDFDGRSQFDRSVQLINGQPSTFHVWVRSQLVAANVVVDPVEDFRDEVRALCRDVSDRADAVNTSLAAGLQRHSHPDALPSNIYGTDGEWEAYSTPSRDARLKASFRELRDTVTRMPHAAAVAPRLRQVWREETARPECRVSYVNSAGRTVSLSMNDVLDRLFTMSFDPYQCAELRWGAPEGSAERASCPDDAAKMHWYAAEQRLRNNIDREYGRPTPLEFGPSAAPDVDVRVAFAQLAPEAPASTPRVMVAHAPPPRVHAQPPRPRSLASTWSRRPRTVQRLGGAVALCGVAATLLIRRRRSEKARARAARISRRLR